MLKEFKPNIEDLTLEEAIRNIKLGAVNVMKNRKIDTDEFKAQHSKLQDAIDKLLQNFVDGLISKEDYKKSHDKLSKKRFSVLQNIAKYDNADDDHCELVIKLLKEVYANCKPSGTIH